MRPIRRADFKLPAMLLALSLVPTLGGVVRLQSVAADATITADNARFLEAPAPVVVHVVCATLYCVLGAFQFSPALRVRWPRWHRRAGRLLVLFGLLAAVSGVWMTAAYRIPAALQGPLLYAVRLAVGSAMAASIMLAWSAIQRRDVASHEAFMIRAYALGQGAGTQVLVLAPWMLITGESGGLQRDLLMTLAWAINVALGEAIIRRQRSSPATRAHALSRSTSRA